MTKFKGIVLAGGKGTRLNPVTLGISKQLLPVYDKPMIYYSLSVLMLAGIRDILIISTPEDITSYQRLLQNGKEFGLNFSYAVQKEPNGLGQAFIIGEKFIGKNKVALILGDNLFYGSGLQGILRKAIKNENCSTIFGITVNDPNRYGVAEIDNSGNVKSIEEKPLQPKSNLAVTGLYFYENEVIDVAKTIKPSKRGEYEITSINNEFIKRNKIKFQLLPRGIAWLDTGTNESMINASQFVHAVEERSGLKIACLEEIALNNKWIKKSDLDKKIKNNINNSYYNYIKRLINENH